MGILPLPSYRCYWSKETRFPHIADVMPVNRYEQVRQYLHFVYNYDSNNENDKLFKVRPIIDAVRNECVQVKPAAYQAVEEKNNTVQDQKQQNQTI